VVDVGAAAKLGFTTQPSPTGSTGGLAFGTQPTVSVQDAGGNTVTTDVTSVVLTLTVPGAAALTCTPSNTKDAVAGVATFAGCKIDVANTYTLTATDTGLTPAVSNNVDVAVGAAAKLAFTTQPSPTGSTGGTAFATQPTVKVQDAGGNTVTTDGSSVLLALTPPGSATLSCTAGNTKVAVSGVATFVGCKIDVIGTYSLTATDTGLTSAVSNNVVVAVGAAAKLAFTTQPANSTGGVPFPTQPVVTVQDAGGNTVNDSSSVTLAITNPGAETFGCTQNPQGAVAGVATFAGCKINFAGTYTLTATDGSLASAASSPTLTISVGAATKLAFIVQPVGSPAGATFFTQPVVALQDAGGNTVTTDASGVTLVVTGGGATLTCTANPQSTVSGLASFAACSIDLAGTYTLTASDLTLTTAVSNNVVIT
jgi:hypothetical protein